MILLNWRKLGTFLLGVGAILFVLDGFYGFLPVSVAQYTRDYSVYAAQTVYDFWRWMSSGGIPALWFWSCLCAGVLFCVLGVILLNAQEELGIWFTLVGVVCLGFTIWIGVNLWGEKTVTDRYFPNAERIDRLNGER
jgi:hypothetical protein